MKIAVPTRNGMVDNHFGHCDYYTIVTLSDNRAVLSTTHFTAPKGCGCKSNVATELKEMGVSVLLAGNMGQGAVNKVTAAGIEVVRGCSGDVLQLINSYASGLVADSGETCDHTHDDGHVCSH